MSTATNIESAKGASDYLNRFYGVWKVDGEVVPYTEGAELIKAY